MFTIKSSNEIRESSNIDSAIEWHDNGNHVLVYGGVTMTRADKTKKLKRITFKELLKYHPSWSIVVSDESGIPPDAKVAHCGDQVFARLDKSTDKKKEALRLFGMDDKIDELKYPPKKKRKLQKLGILKKSKKYIHKDFDIDYINSKMPKMNKNFQMLGELWRSLQYDTNTKILYHGTDVVNINNIFNFGFRIPRYNGMLGRGIYVGQLKKAKNYARGGIILIVEVMLGNCKELDDVENINSSKNLSYDSLHLRSGNIKSVYKGYLRNEEWIIRKPSQIRVVGVVVKE